MVYTTRQKQILSRLIDEAERPLTAQEILLRAQEALPGLGIATVYRSLKQFQRDHQVRAVEIPGVTPHYESASRHHHHFFLCEQCQRLFNLTGCVHGVDALAPQAFIVRRHEIVLYGECAECRGIPSEKEGKP